MSGRIGWRNRAVGKLLLETASSNDVLLFSEVGRMGRSTVQVLEMLETCMERGLIVHIAKLVECSPSTLYDWLTRRHIWTPRQAA